MVIVEKVKIFCEQRIFDRGVKSAAMYGEKN